MNTLQTITQYAYILIGFMAFFIVVMHALNRYIDTPKGGAHFFEWLVTRALKKHFHRKTATVYRNITLEIDGKTSQIDVLLVSRLGLFVVECKNYSGWIFGSPDDARWTQTFWRKKFYFQNPLQQNRKHVHALAQVLHLDPERLSSVVVFSRRCKLKTQMPSNVVWGGKQLINYIEGHSLLAFTPVEVDGINSQLRALKLPNTPKTTRTHIANVKAHNTIQPAPAAGAPTCPKCEIPMVMRLGKKGALAGQNFWGCSTFPKCRQRVQITRKAEEAETVA